MIMKRGIFCKCGCGDRARPGRGYISGHNLRCLSAEQERRRTSWLVGHTLSPDSRKKLSSSTIGKSKSKAARLAMRKGWKLKYAGGYSIWNKGIKTGPLSKETVEKMRGRVPWNRGIHTGIKPWLGEKRGPHSPETRAKMCAAALGKPKSEQHVRNILANNWRKDYRPKYSGIYFRSSYEVRLAKAFDRRGIKWMYEPKRFDLGSCSYLPDFYLPKNKVYWEVKGYFSPESQRKVALFRELHPDKPIIVAANRVIKMMEV